MLFSCMCFIVVYYRCITPWPFGWTSEYVVVWEIYLQCKWIPIILFGRFHSEPQRHANDSCAVQLNHVILMAATVHRCVCVSWCNFQGLHLHFSVYNNARLPDYILLLIDFFSSFNWNANLLWDVHTSLILMILNKWIIRDMYIGTNG